MAPFYPNNMCVFDANSVNTMVKEVVEGQERFSSMFGTNEELTENLKEYKFTVESLKTKYSKFNDLMKTIKDRNFNLLLRQAATIKNSTELLEYLLKNMHILNIDINSKGQKSGTALDVAINQGNGPAEKLLKGYTGL